MKKILLSIILASLTVCFTFAGENKGLGNNFAKLALRDISESSDADPEVDENSEEFDDKPYKSTKRLRGWAHSLILGLSIPQTSLTMKLDEGNLDGKLSGVAFQVGGMSMNLENGITIKYDGNIGGAWSDNINTDVKQSGFDMSYNFGVGWAPLRIEHFRLAILGNVGFSMDYISGDTTYTYGNYKYKQEVSDLLLDFNIGFDVFANIQFNKHFGLYFDLAFKAILKGSDLWTSKILGSTKNQDYDISGHRWVPAFGCVISF